MPDKKTFQRIVAMIITVVIAALASCRSGSDDSAPFTDTQRITRDGVEFQVTPSTRCVTSSEMFHLMIHLRHQPGIDVDLPEVPEKLGTFFVFDTQTTPPQLDADGWINIKRNYTLEPDLPGDSELPSILVLGKNKQGQSFELSSQPIPMTVESVLTAGEKKLRDIAPDDSFETSEPLARWPMALTIANVLVVVCLFVLWRKWKKQRRVVGVDWLGKWAELGEMKSDAMMRDLEPVVTELVAAHLGLKLQARDFEGLADQLQSRSLTVAGLTDAVAQYNQLQYAAYPASDTEVLGLLEQFEKVIAKMISASSSQSSEKGDVS